MKKFIAFVFTALAVVSIAFGEYEIVDGIEYNYTISNGKASIVGEVFIWEEWFDDPEGGGGSSIMFEEYYPSIAGSTSGSLIVPSTLGDCPVTSIGYIAFWGCRYLTSVTIPEGVTTIGYEAFDGCSSLTSVKIPEGVTTIGSYAFYDCSSLVSITIPDSVTEIGSSAFSNCRSLKTIYVDRGDENRVRELLQGKGVNVCDLTFVQGSLPNGGPYKEIVDGVEFTFSILNGEVVIEAEDCSAAISTSTSGALVIPSTLGGCPVTTIGSSAFSSCSLLTSVTIPEGVTTICDEAFYNCSSLTSVTIPNKVTTIGSLAFGGCSSLTSVTIGNSVTTIWAGAFSGCRSLKEVHITDLARWCAISFGSLYANPCFYAKHLYLNGEEIKDLVVPDSVTSIGHFAFSGCSSLTSVTIPKGVTTIGSSVFSGCESLTSVTIPDSVTTIGENAFYSCTSLTTAYVEKGDTARVKEMMRGAGANVDALTFVELELPKADGGPYTETVNGVTYTYFISNGEAKITRAPRSTSGALVIPSTLGGCLVTTIGDEAFLECSSLTSVTIPEGVTTIGEAAFRSCSSLASVTIPSSVTTIGENAFRGCKNLSDIYIMNPNMEPPLTSPFVGCNWDLSIHVPATWHGRNDMLYGYHIEREGSRELVNTVVVTNVVVHYVVNSIQPEFAKPVSEDTGFVNVIAEVKGMSVAVPQTWAENYPEFAAKFGSDFTKALTMKSGKVAMGGREMLVWEDYVAGTDPTDPNDKFTASMTMVDGKPVISWTPQLDDERAAMRKYTTYGKVKLTDSEWIVVPAGQEESYNFFKVTVEMK